jgi:hypothetical protein
VKLTDSVNSLCCDIGTTDGKGNGVFATREFHVGETVVVAVIASRLKSNSSHATQVSRFEWVLLRGMGSMVNHSCNPNCGVRLNESGGPDLVLSHRPARVVLHRPEERGGRLTPVPRGLEVGSKEWERVSATALGFSQLTTLSRLLD